MNTEELTKSIIENLEKNHEDKDKIYMVSGNKNYTINNIINEIKNQTEFGKSIEKGILNLTINLLKRNKKVSDDFDSQFDWS